MLASYTLANKCSGVTSIPSAEIAEFATEGGIGEQKRLALHYYGDPRQKQAAVDRAMRAQGVDPTNENASCAYAREVAGTDSPIGRFLTT